MHHDAAPGPPHHHLHHVACCVLHTHSQLSLRPGSRQVSSHCTTHPRTTEYSQVLLLALPHQNIISELFSCNATHSKANNHGPPGRITSAITSPM
ncbi:hypothetical protein RB213_005967 [Colletotrichum asianum]